MFDAFLSYSRKDARTVERIERDLETFRLPSDLSGKCRRLKVFLDTQGSIGN